jgi:hypothetical protein
LALGSKSTLAGLLGNHHLAFPLYFPFGMVNHSIILEEIVQQLSWLNRPFQTEHEEAIRKALKKTCFLPPKQGWRRSLEELNASLI